MSVDKLNEQINNLEKMKSQIQQPVQQPSINQTFQLTPSQSNIKYANNIEDVNKELVFYDTPFFTRDLSQMWLKNAKGEIKVFELTEIVPKDDKDIRIEMQNQSNPIDLFKQITSNRSPEQMSAFYKQIEQMGFPNDVINQLKDINTK